MVASRFRAETKRKQPPQTKNSSTLDYFQKATSSSIVLMFMGCIRAQWAGSSGCQAAAALCWFSKLRPRTNQPLRKQPLIPLREIKRGGTGKTTKSDVFFHPGAVLPLHSPDCLSKCLTMNSKLFHRQIQNTWEQYYESTRACFLEMDDSDVWLCKVPTRRQRQKNCKKVLRRKME